MVTFATKENEPGDGERHVRAQAEVAARPAARAEQENRKRAAYELDGDEGVEPAVVVQQGRRMRLEALHEIAHAHHGERTEAEEVDEDQLARG
jgi:hypothetical protein